MNDDRLSVVHSFGEFQVLDPDDRTRAEPDSVA